MSGEKNIYKYIDTEGKRTGKFTSKEYYEKNTGVFDGKGMLSPDQIEEMKKRVQNGEKMIWHGFVSINEELSNRIDTPEKCMLLIEHTFPELYREMKLDPKNIDLMAALHLDRKKHYHIHFSFWEKEPKCKYRKKELEYRHKGKISQEALDKMLVRLTLFIEDKDNYLPFAREDSLKELKKLVWKDKRLFTNEEIKKELISLSLDIPKEARIAYGAKDMIPFRERIDKLVRMTISSDKQAREADKKFYSETEKLRDRVRQICKGGKQDENSLPSEEKSIGIVENIEADYRRRQGNIVLNYVKLIRPHAEKLSSKSKRKVNDNSYKRTLRINEKAIDKLFKSFINAFSSSAWLERDYSNRLREIEQEIEEERLSQEKDARKNRSIGDKSD